MTVVEKEDIEKTESKKNPITSSSNERKERLGRAKKHLFSTGLNDVGASLCKANMVYGIAKLHYMQEQLGMEPDATFVSGPDETISRNAVRWKNGFGYGGKISWGDRKTKITVLDVRPNACGMLVGGLEEIPKPNELIERVNDLAKKEAYIDDIHVQWDIGKSNHFIDVYRVIKIADIDIPDYAFIVHSGAPEVKGENARGFGLYYENSPILRDMSEVIDTPFGNIKVITDNNATEYLNFFKFCDSFSKKKRELVAAELFGTYKKVSNILHQGLINYNEILLGTNNTESSGDTLFPIALRADLPAYLFRGLENLTEEMIEILGFSKRAERLGVLSRLQNANLLPHGGGYAFKDMLSVKKVLEFGETRYFVVDMCNARGEKIFEELRNLQYTYRGREVIVRTLELGLGESVAELVPEYILKV